MRPDDSCCVRATLALMAPLWDGYRPNQVVAAGVVSDGSAVPLLHDRSQLDGRSTAYVCRNFTCSPPVTSAKELRTLLQPGG